MALVDRATRTSTTSRSTSVDIGKMRDLLDHLARHGRWVSWGPTRHGIAGNIATYVRITEEPCHVELYCDMERLADDHVPRVYPDDRYSSNTWGPLPPRSYFRFDPVAVEWERESREMLGEPLPPRGDRRAMSLEGFTSPRTPEGRSSLVPYPPWHYVGDFLVIEYWADPEQAVAFLPEGLEPHPDPGPLRLRLRRLAVVLGRRGRARRPVAPPVQGVLPRRQRRCSTARR